MILEELEEKEVKPDLKEITIDCFREAEEELRLTSKTLGKAIEFFDSHDGMKWGFSSVPAGCVYLAGLVTGQHLTQRDVRDAMGVCRPAIRSRYRELADELDVDIQ